MNALREAMSQFAHALRDRMNVEAALEALAGHPDLSKGEHLRRANRETEVALRHAEVALLQQWDEWVLARAQDDGGVQS